MSVSHPSIAAAIERALSELKLEVDAHHNYFGDTIVEVRLFSGTKLLTKASTEVHAPREDPDYI